MDNAQLLDEIRYKLAVEPEDSVAISILGPLSNRQKPGGLPSRIHPKSVRNSRYGTENDSRQRGENMTVAFPVEGKLPRRERDMRSRSAEVPSQSEDQNAEKLKRDKSDSRLSDEEVDESFHEGGYQNKGGEQEKWVKVEYEPDEIDALEFDENRDVFEGTREYAKQMVCKRIKRTNDLRQVVKPHLDQEQVDKLFSRKETNLDEIHTHNTSLLSKLMSEEPPKEIESSPFDEFSQFEASNSSDSKKIKVIYTFGEKQHGIPTYLDIKAKSDAKIKDFVGLSLYKYQQNGFKPEAKPSVKLYKLYLADDIYSYDTDLPPLDGNRYLKDIDFPFLALVEEDEDKLQNEPNSYSVQVYFVDGTCIDYDLDDTDITLGWLKTDALMKREEKRKEDGDKRHQAFDYKCKLGFLQTRLYFQMEKFIIKVGQSAQY
uniref:CRIM domain-containing protein n=3 Tax=Bursaphelenchus xylophilus TaxID=6326 RepID=A0A1I7RYM8_BURXY